MQELQYCRLMFFAPDYANSNCHCIMKPCRCYIGCGHSSNWIKRIMRTGFGLLQVVIDRFYDAISCWPQLHIYQEIVEHFDLSSFLELPVPSDFSYALYFRICR